MNDNFYMRARIATQGMESCKRNLFLRKRPFSVEYVNLCKVAAAKRADQEMKFASAYYALVDFEEKFMELQIEIAQLQEQVLQDCFCIHGRPTSLVISKP